MQSRSLCNWCLILIIPFVGCSAPVTTEESSLSPSLRDEHSIRDNQEINTILEGLASQDITARRSAARKLAAVANPSSSVVVEPVLKACMDEDPVVRRLAITALARTGAKPDSAIPVLAEAQLDEDRSVRSSAVDALGVMAPHAKEAVTSVLKQALVSNYTDARQAAAVVLLRLGLEERESLRTLLELLENDNPEVRHSAAYALGELGPIAKESAAALAKRLLSDENILVRASAAASLGYIRNVPVGAPALAQGLTDGSPLVRTQAAQAIGGFGEQASCAITDLLYNAVNDTSLLSRYAALGALEELALYATDAAPKLAELIGDQDEFTRILALQALRKIGPRGRQAIPILINLANNHQRAQTRCKAINALLNVCDDEGRITPVFQSLLGDRSPEVREEAEFSLKYLHDNSKSS